MRGYDDILVVDVLTIEFRLFCMRRALYNIRVTMDTFPRPPACHKLDLLCAFFTVV